MKSAKKTFFLIDSISLLIFLTFLIFILQLLHSRIKSDFLESQRNEIQKIDLLINSILEGKKTDFISVLDNNQLQNFKNDSFSDFFILNNSYEVTEILKKDDNSGIFEGYSYQYSKVYDFFYSLYDEEVVFSPIFVSPDLIGLSIYIAKKTDGLIYVGRIGIDMLNDLLKRIASYQNSIIILATSDNLIVSGTYDNLPFSILPDNHTNEIFINQRYFYTKLSSTSLNNEIVLLTPVSNAYHIIESVKKAYPLFIGALLLVFFLKIIVQYSYIFRPLEEFLFIVKNRDIEKGNQEKPSIIANSTEIELLFDAYSDKIIRLNESLTEIKRSGEEVFRIKQYLKNIINSMPSMLISIDNNGIIQEWNEAAVKYFGINGTDAIGRNLWDILPYFYKFKESCENSIEDRKIIEFKRELIRNGEDKYMYISIFPLTGNGTKSMGIRLDDITKLEKTEQILRQSQKMETIGTLAGGIAHDFNNVLGGIIGTMSLIKLKLKSITDLDELKEKLTEYISIIDQCSVRASDMVSHLLTVSRKQESNFTYFNLNNAVRDIQKICSNSFDKVIELHFKYYPQTCMVKADLNQIEQVILNVCVNAAHAMTIMRKENEKKGGVLSVQVNRIDTDKHFLKNHPEAKEDIKYWIVSVSDTGIGMEQKTINKIFDPFFTTKEKGKGTGLGLSMVYSIIQQHNGFIDVYSEYLHGTTINIYLPIPEEESISEIEETDVSYTKGEGLILVIDDENLIRETYKEMLSECGYKVILAENGIQGLEKYKQNYPETDLVILDMSMPIMSGIDTYYQLKEFNPKIKVLMASGFRQDERAEQALKAGVNEFIQKPFTINKLSAIVSKLLKQ